MKTINWSYVSVILLMLGWGVGIYGQGIDPVIGPVVNPTANPVIGPVVNPTVNPVIGPVVNPTADPVISPDVDTAIVIGSPSSLPPSTGGHIVPNLQISGSGNVDVSIKYVASGCELDEIELESINSKVCEVTFDEVEALPWNRFPSVGVIVEEDGAYQINFLCPSSTQIPHNPLYISSNSGTIAVSFPDYDIDVHVEDQEEMIVYDDGNVDINATEASVTGDFQDMADYYCPDGTRGPCTGFDIASGERVFSVPKTDSIIQCKESPEKGRFWKFSKNKIYYIRPLLGVAYASSSANVRGPRGILSIRKSCCPKKDNMMASNNFSSTFDPQEQSSSQGCPCENNADPAMQAIFNSIYTTDISNPDYAKLHLFEATLSGDSSYKFSFDPDFDGQVVFYKFGDPTSYSTYSVVANQTFSATDNLTQVTLNDIGDCSTLRMVLGTAPCTSPIVVAVVESGE